MITDFRMGEAGVGWFLAVEGGMALADGRFLRESFYRVMCRG